MEVSGQLHAPCCFTPGERAPGTHWIDGPQSRSRRHLPEEAEEKQAKARRSECVKTIIGAVRIFSPPWGGNFS
jgi:hypothetical protein